MSSGRDRDQRQYGTREGEQEIVEHIRQLFRDGMSHRGIARTLNKNGMLPRKGEWFNKTVGLVIESANRGTQHRNPCTCRMFCTDWVKPRKWSIYWELLRLSDRTFEAMLKAGGIHYDTTINDIRDFRKLRLIPAAYSSPPNQEPRPKFPFLNRVIFGDCLDLIPVLPDESISLVVTSPPYADRRNHQYAGIAPADYPAWTVKWMTAVWDKLTDDGSVRIVIRAYVEDGQLSDYVEKTVTAIRAAGWWRPDQAWWHKPDGAAMGAVHYPRRTVEDILWFSKGPPWVDTKICGEESDRIGREGVDRYGNFPGGNPIVKGTARVTDVITVNAGNVDPQPDHPAKFPPELARENILTFAPPGSTILDPFAGSGTTCLVAQSEDYDFSGFDNGTSSTGELYADVASRRLTDEPKYTRGVAGAGSVLNDDLEVPQQLYDSEISFSISCFWDNRFEVSLGIAPNFVEQANVPRYLAACLWLREAALRRYPESEFANEYGRLR